MMYQPQYFKLYELLPKKFYEDNKSNGVNLWFLFDNRLLWTLDQLRKKHGKLIANTWYWGGHNQYRGWRPFDSLIGAKLSQHKFGRACDLIPIETTVDEVRNDIIKRKFDIDYQHITCVEEEVSWLHIDVRNWDKRNNNVLVVGK